MFIPPTTTATTATEYNWFLKIFNELFVRFLSTVFPGRIFLLLL